MGQHNVNQGSRAQKSSLVERIVRKIPSPIRDMVSIIGSVYIISTSYFLVRGIPAPDALMRPAKIIVDKFSDDDYWFGEGKPKGQDQNTDHWRPIPPPDETYRAAEQQRGIRELMRRHKYSYRDRSELESLLALSEFTTQKPNLQKKDSVQQIDKHLVRIKNNSGSECSGELITTDGWFLSAYHCFDPGVGTGSRMTILIHDNREYIIEIGGYHYPQLDLAIGKADIPERPKPVRMNLFNTDKIQRKQAVRVHGWKDGLVYRQLGKVETTTYHPWVSDYNGGSNKYNNCFETTALSTPGHSGGVTIDHETGGLMGVNSSYQKNDSSNDKYDGVGPGTSAKMNDVLRLINGVVHLRIQDEYRVNVN